MSIIEPVIRPPSEAESFLLQVTTGCSSNSCTFCGAYLNKPFKVKSFKEIKEDIEKGSNLYKGVRRVFLLDGDALVINNNKLLPVLKKVNEKFFKLSRIASYANGYNIKIRTKKELDELFEQKLSLIYIGLESGSQKILNFCKKRSTVEEMVEAVNRAFESGIKSSVIVLLGLGGKKFSNIHVQETIKALNRMQPRYLSFLSLMLIPGTDLFYQVQRSEFQELNPLELLKQSYDIIKGLDLKKTIFRSNHASNYISLAGRFPQDKEYLLRLLRLAINGEIKLKPEFLRGL